MRCGSPRGRARGSRRARGRRRPRPGGRPGSARRAPPRATRRARGGTPAPRRARRPIVRGATRRTRGGAAPARPWRGPPYATSRISTWRNRNAVSPETVEIGSRVRSWRSTRSASAVSTSSAGSSSATAPRQKTRPTSAPWRTTDRESGGSRSIRDAISACTVSGIRTETPLAPLGEHPDGLLDEQRVALRLVEQRLPDVVRQDRVGDEGVDEHLGLAPRASGPRSIAIDRRRPPPQPARDSSSSGRARHTISTGASSIRSARCSTRSRRGSSAQWRSSKPSTSGCASARLTAHSCAAQAIS